MGNGKPFGGKPHWNPLPWYPLPYMQMYLDALERKTSRQVCTNHRRALSYFGMFAQVEGIRHPEELERIHILRYQAWLLKDARTQHGRAPSDGYRRDLLRMLQSWIEWLAAENHITKTPWERIVLGTRRRKRSTGLDMGEIKAAFDEHRRQAFSLTPFSFHRREALLAVMFAWGLSNGEILALNVPNLDMRQEFIEIRFARGERVKRLPYGAELKGVLGRWLQLRSRHAKSTEDAVFIDATGERMSPANLQKIMNDLGERAGVKLSVIRMRNTYGARLLENGTDRKVVAALLGLAQEDVRLYDPLAQKKLNAISPISAELAELLGHDRPNPEYRRTQ